MAAGRRKGTYLGPHFPSAGSAASSSNSAHFLNLPLGELASVIFGCTHATYDECVKQLIFGLPEPHYSYVKHISPGMPLFLFNYSDRKLHGIYEAESHGDLNINPYAWTSGKAGKTQFPAQVRVRVKCRCQPLTEKVFKEAIAANYIKDSQNRFYFELNHIQKDMVVSFFMRNATYMSPQPGPSAWRQAGDEEGWNKPKKTTKSTLDAWNNASPFIPAAAVMSSAQNGEMAHTPEHWEDGSVKVPVLQEWEWLARERCLQEQTMLREERELIREKIQASDAPVARAINKHLEICASAIAQMRQDEIKFRHLMDEALNQVELLRDELDQLRKKNAS